MGAQVLAVSEHHQQGNNFERFCKVMSRQGWYGNNFPAEATAKGGTSGGVMLWCKNGINSAAAGRYMQGGCGWSAQMIRMQNVEVMVISVYLKSGTGLCEVNLEILGP